ncbi:MAG TPA: hypothetical protein VIA81_11325 [Acidimicrobiia bacterium]
MAGDDFFPYDFDGRFALVWLGLGVKPKTDGVTLTTDGRFVATYGRWQVETPISNIASATREGPYRWWRAVGLRGSGADTGITFGTTPRAGVCLIFVEPIPRVVPPRRTHENLTVTVADPDGLIRALRKT